MSLLIDLLIKKCYINFNKFDFFFSNYLDLPVDTYWFTVTIRINCISIRVDSLIKFKQIVKNVLIKYFWEAP